jgi:hypothetical protein
MAYSLCKVDPSWTALLALGTSFTCVFGNGLGWCEIPVTSAIDGRITLLHVLPWRSSSGFTLLDGIGNTDVQLNYSRAYDTIEGVWGFVMIKN